MQTQSSTADARESLTSAARNSYIVPDPQKFPTVSVPEAGRAFGLNRAGAYRAARRGDIPTIKLGRRVVVPTAKLRELLGLDAI